MAAKGNFHENYRGHQEVKSSSDRSFGIVFAVVFLIIGLWPLLDANMPRWWSIVIAAGFLGVAFIRPQLLAPLNRIWTRIGLLLHKVVNPIVMGFLFYLVVTPMGLIRRIVHRDPLRLKFDESAKSYWIEREPGPAPETMKQQF